MPVSDVLPRVPEAAKEFASIWKLSEVNMCALIEHFLRQGQFWAAEMVLKTYFLEDFRPNTEIQGDFRVHSHLDDVQVQEAWNSIQWFVEEHPLEDEEHPLLDEEQKLWAKIAILETFCEGVLQKFSEDLLRRYHPDGLGRRGWSFAKVISHLRHLVGQAVRDEKLEWTSSRACNRYWSIQVDKDVAEAIGRGDITWNRRNFKILLQSSRDSEDRHDQMMVASVHWRIRSLGYGEGPKAKAYPSLIPLKVYAQREKNLLELKEYCSKSSGGGHECWPSPVKLTESDGQKEHVPEGKVISEQGSPRSAGKQKEAVSIETAKMQGSITKRSLAPNENLWVLLEGEREANRDLRQEVQRLKRLVAELPPASNVNHKVEDSITDRSQREWFRLLTVEQEANQYLRQVVENLQRSTSKPTPVSDVNREGRLSIVARNSDDFSLDSTKTRLSERGRSPEKKKTQLGGLRTMLRASSLQDDPEASVGSGS